MGTRLLHPGCGRTRSAVIAARGASSAASAANAAIDHVSDWVGGTAPDTWTSAGVVSDGSYGVPEGLVAGLPVTSHAGRCQIVHNLPIDEFSRQRINDSVAELQDERDMVVAAGLIPEK
jgi:malate dehydrogenase